jgi:hypothetical protein
MGSRIAKELKEHIPFTALGALTGIGIMVMIVLGNVPSHVSHTIFHTLHPLHVFLSALVTTAMYMRYKKGKTWAAVLIGWTGAIGIGTISDALIPYLGGTWLGARNGVSRTLYRNRALVDKPRGSGRRRNCPLEANNQNSALWTRATEYLGILVLPHGIWNG